VQFQTPTMSWHDMQWGLIVTVSADRHDILVALRVLLEPKEMASSSLRVQWMVEAAVMDLEEGSTISLPTVQMNSTLEGESWQQSTPLTCPLPAEPFCLSQQHHIAITATVCQVTRTGNLSLQFIEE